MAQYTPAVEEQQVGAGGIWFLPTYVAVIVAIALLLAQAGAEEIRAVVILLVLTPLTFLIFARAARADVDGAFLYRLLLLAWPVKLAAMGLKLYLLFHVYRSADAFQYYQRGQVIAATLASGALPDLSRGFISTEFVELITGVFFFAVGPAFVGAWIVWSWLATMGMLAHYKAFATALPQGARRFFAVLIFFSPTLLMWPNALGKDALVAFTLGIATYGVAQVSRRGLGLGPLLWIIGGLGGTFLVRPHIAAIVAVALAGAILLRPIRAGVLTPFIRIGTFLAMAVLAVVVVRVAASYLSLELTVEGVTGYFEEQTESSQQGETAFEGQTSFPTTPPAIALAVVTVLFRPFPWETGGVMGLGIALEGLALIALILYRWRSVLRGIWEARQHAYLAYAVIYAAIFTIAFSVVSNFGILSRQRAQVLPFIFILLAYQGWRGRTPSATDAWSGR